MLNRLITIYDRLVLNHPVFILLLIVGLGVVSSVKMSEFRLDASADSLVLENDKSLEFYRQMRERFESSDDFLIVTFTPKSSLFTPESLSILRQLRDDFAAHDRVTSTNSILNVPLLNSPDLNLENISEQIRTLDEHDVPMEEARDALVDNPLYRNLLISEDAQTTAIQIVLASEPRYYELLKERKSLRDAVNSGQASDGQRHRLVEVSTEFDQLSERLAAQQDQDVADIRAIIEKYQDRATIHLGGVPMIVSDMIAFVASDLETFGVGVFIFLVLTLTIIFRQWQWITLPLTCCLVTVWFMIGILGWMSWPVTVISSNFVSLLLIITLSLTIHITVRFREIQLLKPDATVREIMRDTVQAMSKPCLYMALTTIVAFGSLIFSDIRPVIDFGKMMTLGISIAFIVAFLLLPVSILMLPSGKAPKPQKTHSAVTAFLARFTEAHGNKILLGCLLLAVFFVIGITRLTVENRFIDYFKESTEIYQGMVVIDHKIGGTAPLDIIIDDIRVEEPEEEVDPFLDDCFDDEDACEYEDDVRNTWYTFKKIEQLEKVHEYLESLPESGKVLSIATTLKLVQEINQGVKLDAVQLAFLPKVFPEDLAEILIEPYISDELAQARFNLRVIESSPGLNRQQLLNTVRAHLTGELGYADENVHFTGMTVLYNNMLQSLFDSQIKTLGIVFVAIMLMLLVLFRSVSLAIIGMAPNILAASSVLGVMGWLGIPLDMMTITVAAITVGIAVDNTIHYIFRFRVEFAKDGDYLATMHRCHGTIGRAMFYTSITIIAGFSILVLSNFLPTIYFGLFTGMAMFVALLGALSLLPQLLLWFKPKLATA